MSDSPVHLFLCYFSWEHALCFLGEEEYIVFFHFLDASVVSLIQNVQK